MALISAAEYRRLRALEDKGEPAFGETPKCAVCEIILHEAHTGCRRMGDGTFRCSDCYFDALEEVDVPPILPPRIRRRA